MIEDYCQELKYAYWKNKQHDGGSRRGKYHLRKWRKVVEVVRQTSFPQGWSELHFFALILACFDWHVDAWPGTLVDSSKPGRSLHSLYCVNARQFIFNEFPRYERCESPAVTVSVCSRKYCRCTYRTAPLSIRISCSRTSIVKNHCCLNPGKTFGTNSATDSEYRHQVG